MIYVTDTHPLIWLLAGDARLSAPARQALTDSSAVVILPAIVRAEIQFLHAKKRILVSLSDVLSLVARTKNMNVHPFDEHTAARLPDSLDIHDAMIVSTALVYVRPLGEPVAQVTKDQEITRSGLVSVLW